MARHATQSPQLATAAEPARCLPRLLQHRPAPPCSWPTHPAQQAYDARPKAVPTSTPLDDSHYRIRHDTIDPSGVFTLRHNSRLHHIGIGRRHAGTDILVLVHDLHVRVLTTDGELLRELQLDPSKDYQRQPKLNDVPRHLCMMSRDITAVPPAGFEPATHGLGKFARPSTPGATRHLYLHAGLL
jgi:hypothetical protein